MQVMADQARFSIGLRDAQEWVFSAQEWGPAGVVSEGSPEEAGDLAAQIVELHPRHLRFARSLTHDREAAEYLAQETMLAPSLRRGASNPARVSRRGFSGLCATST
jgi:hypothetical protein